MEALNDENSWIHRVAAARRRLPAWVAVLLAVAILAVVLEFFGRSVLDHSRLRLGAPLLSEVLSRGSSYLALFLPLYLCTYVSIHLWEVRPRMRGSLSPLEGALVGSFVGLSAFAGVLIVSLLAGVLTLEHPMEAPSLATLFGVAAGGVLLAIQTGAEEWFFRGWLQPILCTNWGVGAGLVISAALFAAAHGFAGIQTPVGLLNVFLAGLVFGLLALRTGGLATSIAAHWIWNWLEQSVVGLTPNPGVDALGSLADLKLVGSSLAGAGVDELDGALAVTVAFGILAVTLVCLPTPRITSRSRATRRYGRAP